MMFELAKLIQDGTKGLIKMGFLPAGHKTKNIFVFSHPDAKDTEDEDKDKEEEKEPTFKTQIKIQKIVNDKETAEYKLHDERITINYASDE